MPRKTRRIGGVGSTLLFASCLFASGLVGSVVRAQAQQGTKPASPPVQTSDAKTPPSPAPQRGQGGANSSAAALAAFTEQVNKYVALQKKLAAQVGELDETKSQAEIAAREKALGAAIRAARPNAKAGDIFTKAASAIFIRVIREEFQQRSKMALDDREEAQDELPNFTPTVNQVYPSTFPLATFPPGVLRRIPVLPKELEYRFVQRHLILRDTEANLIVDIISNAAPPPPPNAAPRRAPENQ